MTSHIRRFVPVACIAAAILLAGCSNNSPTTATAAPPTAAPSTGITAPSTMPAPPSTPAPSPAPATTESFGIQTTALGAPLIMPDGQPYDEWSNWTSGNTTSELLAAGKALGLDNASIPNANGIQQGYTTIAQFSTGCVVIFTTVAASSKDNLTVLIESRYTPNGLQVVKPNVPLTQTKPVIDEYRALCTADPNVPATTLISTPATA